MADFTISENIGKLIAQQASQAASMSTNIEKTLNEAGVHINDAEDTKAFAKSAPTYISLLGLIKNFGDWAIKMDFKQLNSKLAPFYVEYGKFAEKIHGISTAPDVVKDLQNSVVPIAKVSASIAQLSKTSVDIDPDTLPKMLSNLSQSLNVLAKSGDLKNSKKYLSSGIKKIGEYLNDVNKLLEEDMLADPKKATDGFNAVITIFEDYDKILGYVPTISKHAIRIIPFMKLFKWSNGQMFSLVYDLYDKFGNYVGEEMSTMDAGFSSVDHVMESMNAIFVKMPEYSKNGMKAFETGAGIRHGVSMLGSIVTLIKRLFCGGAAKVPESKETGLVLYDSDFAAAQMAKTQGVNAETFDSGAICKTLAGIGKVLDTMQGIFQKTIALETMSLIVKHAGKFIKSGLDAITDIMCNISDLFNPQQVLPGKSSGETGLVLYDPKFAAQQQAAATPEGMLTRTFKIVSAVKTIFDLITGTFAKIVACAALAIPVAIGCIPVSAALLALKGVVWEVCKLFGDGGTETQSQQAANNMNAIYGIFSSMASAFLKIIIAAALAPIVVVALGSLIITFSAIKGLMWIMGHLFSDGNSATAYNSATAGLTTNGPMSGIKMLGVFALGMLSLLATFLLVSIAADKIEWGPVLGFLATALVVFGAFTLILKLVDTIGFDKSSAIALGLMSLELVAFALELAAISLVAKLISFGLVAGVLLSFIAFAGAIWVINKLISTEALLMVSGMLLVLMGLGLAIFMLGKIVVPLGAEGLKLIFIAIGGVIAAITVLAILCKIGPDEMLIAVGVLLIASVALYIIAKAMQVFANVIDGLISIFNKLAKMPAGTCAAALSSAAGMVGAFVLIMTEINLLSVPIAAFALLAPVYLASFGMLSAVIGSMSNLIQSTAAMEISYHDPNGKLIYRKLNSSDLTAATINIATIVGTFKGILVSIFKDPDLNAAINGMGYISRSNGEKILILLNESVKPLGKIMELIKNLAAFEITVHVGGKNVTRQITNSDLSAASDNLSTVMKKYTEIVGAVVSDGNLLKSSAGSSFFNYSSGEEVMRLLDASVNPIAKIFKVVSELSVFEVVSHDAHGRKHYQKLTSSLLKKANGNLKTTVGGFIGIVKAVTTGKNSTELYNASMGSTFFTASKGESIMKLLDQSVRPIGKIVGIVSKMAAGEYSVHGAGGKIEYHHIWNKTIIDAETMTTKIMTAFGRIVSATCNIKNLQALADDGVFSDSNGKNVMDLLTGSIKPISAVCSIIGSLAAGEYAAHGADGKIVYKHLWQKTINDAELSGKKIITAYSNILTSMNNELLPKVAGNNFWSNATFTNSLKSQSAAIAIMAGTLQGIANGKMRVYNGQGELMRTVSFNYKEIAASGKSNKLSNMIEWYTNAVTGFNGGASRSGLGFFLRFNGEYEHMAKTTASIVKTVNGLDPGKFRIYTDTFKEMNKFTEKMGKNMDKLIDAIGNKLVPQLAKLTSPKPTDAKLTTVNGKHAPQHAPAQPVEQKPTHDTQLIIDTLVATIDDLKQTIADLSDNTYKVKIKQ